jgi:polyferredoxin
VQVCPTGIDIRNGLQYECIGCAACVDVCDTVMDRMGYARGLVRYATQRALDERFDRSRMLRNVLRPRVLVYGMLLLLLLGALLGSLATRNPLKVDVIRDRNALARVVEGGNVENTYRLHLMNASETPRRLQVTVEGLDGLVLTSAGDHEVAAASNRAVPIAVQAPADAGRPGSNPIRFVIRDRDHPAVQRSERSVFLVPR